MKCEIFRNNTKIAGPIEFNPIQVKDIVARQGANAELVPPALTSAVSINGTMMIKPVREVRPNLTAGQRYGTAERTENEYEVVYTYQVVDKSDDELKTELLKRLSAIHDTYEQARFNYNNVMIKADLEARINAKAALEMFQDGTLTATEWRGKAPSENNDPLMGPGGSDNTNARLLIQNTAEMAALYGAIVNYLSKGFAARSAIEDEIKNADRATLVSYDLMGKFNTITGA